MLLMYFCILIFPRHQFFFIISAEETSDKEEETEDRVPHEKLALLGQLLFNSIETVNAIFGMI